MLPDWPMRWLPADPTQLRRVVDPDWSPEGAAWGERPGAHAALGLLQAYLKPFLSPSSRN